jgi:hypothetical protein
MLFTRQYGAAVVSEELTKYYAVMKKVGTGSPLSVHFFAKDDTDAVAELCAAAGVQNTNGLLEFEILEVLPRGEYRRAALKTARKTTTEERLEANRAPIVPPKPVIRVELEERTYTPYTHKLAA